MANDDRLREHESFQLDSIRKFQYFGFGKSQEMRRLRDFKASRRVCREEKVREFGHSFKEYEDSGMNSTAIDFLMLITNADSQFS